MPDQPTLETPQSAQEAAAILLDRWQTQTTIDTLPPSCRPVSRTQAYRVQQAMLSLSGRRGYGWKIAATSAAGQSHIGVDGPLAGRLHDTQVYADGSLLALGNNLMRVAELEFAFVMARSLPPRDSAYGVEEVMAGVGTLHPAIEIPDSRFRHFVSAGAAQLIADNACADRFVLGPSAPADWRKLDLSAHRVTGEVTGLGSIDGIGRNVLGDPRIALCWLVNELSSQGITLAAGEVVTTGTCVTPVPIAPTSRVTGDFGVLGQVSVSFR